jgi:CpeT/CpcT family (DUF1001)
MRNLQVAGSLPHMRARASGAPSGGALAIGALAFAAVALAGCADSGLRRGQADLAALQRALPGVYTGGSASTGAASTGAAAGSADSDAGDAAGSSAVTLSIQPITAQVLGDAVYFVRETPADNANLVLAQGIWTLALGGSGDRSDAHESGHDKSDSGPAIVQHRFLFKDPRRWVGAADNPDLLLSILPQDLQALPGCDLVWHRTSTGFEAGSEPQSCQPGSGAQGLWIEQHAQLQGKQLSLLERRTGADGALDTGGPPLSLQLARTGSAQ